MNKCFSVFIVVVVSLLSGCGVLPQYHAAPGASTAKLNLKSAGSKWICVSGERHRLVGDSTGYADIPAGARLTIGSNYYYNDGYVSTSCNPRTSLVPEPSQRYYIDFEIESDRCFALIFKEDATTRTGLALEPTLSRSSECATK